MKNIINHIILNSVSLVLAIGAVILAYAGKDGWMVIALLAYLTQTEHEEDNT